VHDIIEITDCATIRSKVYDIGRGSKNQPETHIVAESLGIDRPIMGFLCDS
jgi:hypothetical protein